jgi:anti-anti-sigma factor
VAANLGVLTIGVLRGIVIGILLSFVWLVRRSTNPAIAELGRPPGSRSIDQLGDDVVAVPGVLVIRFDAGLFFANTETLSDRVQALRARRQSEVREIVLSCEGINFVDAQGAETLKELAELSGRDGIGLRLSRVKPEVLAVLERDGLVALIGPDRIHFTTPAAVEAAEAAVHASGSPAPGDPGAAGAS